MQPISLVTKGMISPRELITNFSFPFNIAIDYGEKIINLSIEDETLDVVIEQENINVQAGQEEIDVTLDQPNVEIKN